VLFSGLVGGARDPSGAALPDLPAIRASRARAALFGPLQGRRPHRWLTGAYSIPGRIDEERIGNLFDPASGAIAQLRPVTSRRRWPDRVCSSIGRQRARPSRSQLTAPARQCATRSGSAVAKAPRRTAGPATLRFPVFPTWRPAARWRQASTWRTGLSARLRRSRAIASRTCRLPAGGKSFVGRMSSAPLRQMRSAVPAPSSFASRSSRPAGASRLQSRTPSFRGEAPLLFLTGRGRSLADPRSAHSPRESPRQSATLHLIEGRQPSFNLRPRSQTTVKFVPSREPRRLRG